MPNNGDANHAAESENPSSMESIGQMFGFLLYVSEIAANNKASSLSIPKGGKSRIGMAKVINAYDLPTSWSKYSVKYHTAAENALSHCYRSCLELLIENGLQSIAMGCIYTESKNYPREPAAHVAISLEESGVC